MTTQTADLVAVMRARDEMSPAFRRAGNEVRRTDRLMGGFNRGLATIGLSTLSLAVAFKSLISAQDRTQKSTAATNLLVSQLGPEFAQAVKDMEPSFEEIAKQFGFTESVARQGFGVLISESRNAGLGIDALAAAMGLARLANIPLSEAAKILGQLLLGDASAARQFATDLGDLNKFMADSARLGLEATTAADKWGAAWRQAFEDLASSSAFKFLLESLTPENLFNFDIKPPEGTFKLPTAEGGFFDSLASDFNKFKEIWNAFWSVDVPLADDELWRGMNEEQKGFAEKFGLLWGGELLVWIANAWGSMTTKFGEWRNAFTNFWTSTLPSFVADLWVTMSNFRQSFQDFLGTFFGQTLPDTIRSALGDAVNAVINAIPSWIRDLVTGNFSIPSFPSIPSIPGFAHGGVVPGAIGRPVLATVHGGETITPPGGGNRGGNGPTMIFNIGSIDSEIRARQVAREMSRLITENNRRGVPL